MAYLGFELHTQLTKRQPVDTMALVGTEVAKFLCLPPVFFKGPRGYQVSLMGVIDKLRSMVDSLEKNGHRLSLRVLALLLETGNTFLSSRQMKYDTSYQLRLGFLSGQRPQANACRGPMIVCLRASERAVVVM